MSRRSRARAVPMISERLVSALLAGMTVNTAWAMDFSVQPRFESGVAYYELEQRELAAPQVTSARTVQRISKVTSSDVMAFVGGGVALFADRFYLDFSAQHFFNGSDNPRLSSTNINPAGTVPFIPTDTLTENTGLQQNDFNRTEWSVALGYNIFDYWSVYVGYKQSSTHFDERLSGTVETSPLAQPQAAINAASGNYTADAELMFEYDGPFLGTHLAWHIDKGPLPGVLSGNVGVAFLDGQSRLSVRNFQLTNRDGATFPVDVEVPGGPTLGIPFDGSAIGVNFGLNWRGYTPVAGLTYAVGVSGYRYEFDTDSDASFGLNETLIKGSLGLAYTFDL